MCIWVHLWAPLALFSILSWAISFRPRARSLALALAVKRKNSSACTHGSGARQSDGAAQMTRGQSRGGVGFTVASELTWLKTVAGPLSVCVGIWTKQ